MCSKVSVHGAVWEGKIMNLPNPHSRVNLSCENHCKRGGMEVMVTITHKPFGFYGVVFVAYLLSFCMR